MTSNTARIAVTLPSELRLAVDQAVREGRAKSRNELMANALRRELAALERAAIDADFALMAQDQTYQEEARRLTAEFESSDWEAFQTGELRG